MGAEYEAAMEVRGAIQSLDDTVGRLVGAVVHLNRLRELELRIAFGREMVDGQLEELRKLEAESA